LNEKNVLHASWGYYSQFPPLFETDKVYGNPDLSARKATHYILSVETETVKNISIKLENFYKTYHNLPLEDDIKSYTNKGEGYAYGLGLLIQRRNSEKLNGWLSYSYTRSMRKEYEQKSIYRPDFDVPHRVSVVATYNLPGNWQLGMKWLYSTGRPYTPIVNSYKDSISGYYVPVFGKINSKRLPDYHTLEFRGLKKWTFENWNLTVFIEVMNLYNHMNIAEYKWNEDYTERSEMQYYPLIPSIGVIARL
jgi:outer membrane receptor protein involved in Fe transport